jgi:hypothetical protein
MNKLHNLLKFLRLEDENGFLSLTNIAVLVCIVKVAMMASVGVPDLGALMLSMLNYGHKKHLAKKKDGVNAEEVQALKAKVDEHAFALKQVDTDAIVSLKKNVEELLQAEVVRRMKGGR